MGDDLAELIAVDAGEVAVEDDDVVGVDVELRDGFVAVVGDVDGDPLVAQSFRDPVGVARHVLDDEDSHVVVSASCGMVVAGSVIWTRRPPSARAWRSSVPVVRGGDGGDDRQPEPVSVLRSGAVLAEAFERLGELRDGVLVEHRAAAVDNHVAPAADLRVRG